MNHHLFSHHSQVAGTSQNCHRTKQAWPLSNRIRVRREGYDILKRQKPSNNNFFSQILLDKNSYLPLKNTVFKV
jgi:hypothetical protein